MVEDIIINLEILFIGILVGIRNKEKIREILQKYKIISLKHKFSEINKSTSGA